MLDGAAGEEQPVVVVTGQDRLGLAHRGGVGEGRGTVALATQHHGAVAMQVQLVGVRPGDRPLVRVLPLIRTGLHTDDRLVQDAVVDVHQLVVEPAVQGVDPHLALGVERIDMAEVSEEHLAVHALLTEHVPPGGEVAGLDIGVLQAVHDQRARGDLGGVVVRPVAVVARSAQKSVH